jgi:5'-3' exonuclease
MSLVILQYVAADAFAWQAVIGGCAADNRKLKELRLTDSNKATKVARKLVFSWLGYLIRTYTPQRSFNVVFDGVASLAKVTEQRKRRERDWISARLDSLNAAITRN